jgi:Aldo/keto reductase family
MLDRFVEAGGNLVDTADTSLDGVAEETLGRWLARRRADVVVATKVRFPVSDPGGEGLAPDRVRRACDASLRRLGVDEIDLYLLNAPDPSVPARGHAGRAGRAGARGQGAGARLLELPRLPAGMGDRAPGPRGLGAVGLRPAAVLARRALDRARAAAHHPLRGRCRPWGRGHHRTDHRPPHPGAARRVAGRHRVDAQRRRAHPPRGPRATARRLPPAHAAEQAGIGDPAVLTRPRAQ